MQIIHIDPQWHILCHANVAEKKSTRRKKVVFSPFVNEQPALDRTSFVNFFPHKTTNSVIIISHKILKESPPVILLFETFGINPINQLHQQWHDCFSAESNMMNQ